MCDQDDVERILQRTRAQRERLNRHLIDNGEKVKDVMVVVDVDRVVVVVAGSSPHALRSPLREKNSSKYAGEGSKTASPSKVVRVKKQHF